MIFHINGIVKSNYSIQQIINFRGGLYEETN
jgi:hypothetical protein